MSQDAFNIVHLGFSDMIKIIAWIGPVFDDLNTKRMLFFSDLDRIFHR